MKSDYIVIGAGVAGLSLAWTLRQRGKSVIVLERGQIARGASVRNFGMVWPVGHPLGEVRELALRSREIWLNVASQAEIWHRTCGSMTLAYEDLEWQVIHEFLDQANRDESVGRLIGPDEVIRRNPHVKSDRLIGALYSATEVCVDPRSTVHKLADWLQSQGLPIHFGVNIGLVESGRATATDGTTWEADHIIVCSTIDAHRLIPSAQGLDQLRRCDLHMLRLFPNSADVPRLDTHLCAGLTLGHYANFKDCPSLPQLKAFHAEKWPSQAEFGIHVLVSQHADGSLTVGDSHHYGDDLPPYMDAKVDDAILAALNEFLDVSDYSVGERWIGTYSTSPGKFYSWMPVSEGVHALSLFGTGMTLSFGVAERVANEICPA